MARRATAVAVVGVLALIAAGVWSCVRTGMLARAALGMCAALHACPSPARSPDTVDGCHFTAHADAPVSEADSFEVFGNRNDDHVRGATGCMCASQLPSCVVAWPTPQTHCG